MRDAGFAPWLPALWTALALGAPDAARAEEPGVVSLAGSAARKAEGGDWTGAAEDLTRAIGLAPESASLRHERARCRAKLGDAAGAEADIGAAAKLAPDEYPLDVALWRQAVDESRRRGSSKEPNLALVAAEVAAIRERAFTAPVASGTRSADEVAAFVDEVVGAQPAAGADDGRSPGLARLGLVPPSFDVGRESARALLSQIAAYYDPRAKRFFVLDARLAAPALESVAAHELAHALQDQRVDLVAWFERHAGKTPGVRDDDRAMALRCVAEGEATYVQTIWQCARSSPDAAADLRRVARARLAEVAAMGPAGIVRLARAEARAEAAGGAAGGSAADLARVEPYLLVPFLAAYVEGANFVASVEASKDGWAAVDRLFASPPETMEQCLHPQKWLEARDRPSRLELPALPEVAAAGWTAADAAVHGELYLRALLLRQGLDAAVAAKSAAGWDGDVYRAWRGRDGAAAIVLATTWDTVRDAQEFFDGYRAGLPRKYAKLAEEPGSDLSAIRYSYGDAALGTGALLLRGREVFAVEGFDAALRESIAAAMVAMQVESVE